MAISNTEMSDDHAPDLLAKLRAARESPHELLTALMKLRARAQSNPILAVEGSDDVTFYDAVIRRKRADSEVHFLVCDGKSRALRLRQILSRNLEPELSGTKFAFDHDFDGLRGQKPGDDVYVTPVYSIENLLVNRDVLKAILNAEFRCSRDVTGEELEGVLELFEHRISELCSIMKMPNEILHYARRKGLKLNSIDNNLKKYARVRLDDISSVASPDEVSKLIGFDTPPDAEDVSKMKDEFDKLEPLAQWRGKFFYEFLRIFLSLLKEDRGSRTPSYFLSKQVVSFEPSKDLFRTLASIFEIPKCLEQFVAKI